MDEEVVVQDLLVVGLPELVEDTQGKLSGEHVRILLLAQRLHQVEEVFFLGVHPAQVDEGERNLFLHPAPLVSISLGICLDF